MFGEFFKFIGRWISDILSIENMSGEYNDDLTIFSNKQKCTAS